MLSPGATRHDDRDIRASHVVATRDGGVRLPGRSAGADITYGLPRQLAGDDMTATLGAHVSEVVLEGPKEQMGRVYAWPIVAMVTDVHPGRDRSEVEFPREAVGVHVTPPVPPDSKASVATGSPSGPEPAALTLLDLRPETGDLVYHKEILPCP